MGFTLASDFQLQGDHPSENRVGGSRGVRQYRARKIGLQVVEPHQENSPTPTKTVSGIPYWLSRDPIAENGGINLYAYTYNNPINLYDPDGRHPAVTIAGAALAKAGINAGVGAVTGAATGAVAGFVGNADAPTVGDLASGIGKSALAGATGGAVGGFLSGFGENPLLDGAGGYLGAKASNAVSNSFSDCPPSDKHKSIQQIQEIVTAGVAALPLGDTFDAIAIGLSSGVGNAVISRGVELAE